MIGPRSLAIAFGLALGAIRGGFEGFGADVPPGRSAPVDREAWARRLAGLNGADWRTAYAVGLELAALPADEGFAILKSSWEKIDKAQARQQLLKAWYFEPDVPAESRIRQHPRLLDAIDLGMQDRSPAVQAWATRYATELSFRDSAEDFQAYKAWYEDNRGRPLPEVVARSARRFAGEAARTVRAEATRRAFWLIQHVNAVWEIPEARRGALDGGLARTLGRWASAADVRSGREEIQLAVYALQILHRLRPEEPDLRRVVLPLIAREKPVQVRSLAIQALGGQKNAWAFDVLLETLERSIEEDMQVRGNIAEAAASALVTFDDPRVIPSLIAVIAAIEYDNTAWNYQSALNRLTGVRYDPSHGGGWWRRWWEKNREKYPEAVRVLEIPRLPRGRPLPGRATVDPPADVEGIRVHDLRAGGDEKKR